MNISLQEKHFLFEHFSKDLPDFTIITGLSGSGKTILLNSIKTKTVKNDFETNENLISLIENISFRGTSKLGRKDLYENSYHFIFNKFFGVRTASMDATLPPDLQIAADKATKYLGKDDFSQISDDDLKKLYLIDKNENKNGLFKENFFSACLQYAEILSLNQYNEYLTEVKGMSDKFYMSTEEFLKFYGEAPWEIINKVFESAKINYTLDVSDLTENAFFEIYFINKSTGAKITYEGLSSGEQIIMSTTFGIYTLKNEYLHPKILLFDEPDASLHPSLIKHFINVIEEVFVKSNCIKVIITTHSPTTVALAPKDSIYTMTGSKSVIESSSRDAALKILTEGVPSFSVNYVNRRQIFVESDFDEIFYSSIYTILKNRLINDISLYFISSGVGPNGKNGQRISNCGQVITVVETLRDNGNKFVWGIIDRDKDNISTDYVKVLGTNQRYSIENYIFDTFTMAALLLKKGIISTSEFGLQEHETYTNFKDFKEEKLQYICDVVHKKLEPTRSHAEKLFKKNIDEGEILCKTISGQHYKIPLWIAELKGHFLEDEVYMKAFPTLDEIKMKKEGKLKLAIINEIWSEIPEIIPQDILDLFTELQEI